eukprot:m.361510 g.361510  ORF g.361510 m.361510 type:complete len:56 (+) comp19648_c0_seq1:1685-1852(+)
MIILAKATTCNHITMHAAPFQLMMPRKLVDADVPHINQTHSDTNHSTPRRSPTAR